MIVLHTVGVDVFTAILLCPVIQRTVKVILNLVGVVPFLLLFSKAIKTVGHRLSFFVNLQKLKFGCTFCAADLLLW